MRSIVFISALVLLFSQICTPIIAQDSNEEVGDKEAENKPLWDDGGKISDIIKGFSDIEKVPLATPITEKDVDMFCRHVVDFKAVAKTNGCRMKTLKTVYAYYSTAVDAEWFKKWADERQLEDSGRWLRVYVAVLSDALLNVFIPALNRDIEAAREELEDDNLAKERRAELVSLTELYSAQLKEFEKVKRLPEADIALLSKLEYKITHALNLVAGSIEQQMLDRFPERKDITDRLISSKMKASRHIAVHGNPKAGQYWVTTTYSLGMAFVTRLQIVSIKDDKAIIEQAKVLIVDNGKAYYVHALEVNLTAKEGEDNVLKAWLGKPGGKGEEVEIDQQGPVLRGDEPEGDDEEFSEMPLAGKMWAGKYYKNTKGSIEYNTWIAKDGYFDGLIKYSVAGSITVLSDCGDDAEALLDIEIKEE